MKKIDIVIVNWNSGNQLFDCIQSIVNHHNDFVRDVIVVDNSSTDLSLSLLDSLVISGCHLNVIRNAMNLGFAKACNQGAASTRGEYILFLNPDARLFEGTLIGVVDSMQNKKNYNIGIIGVKLLGEDGNMSISAARFPTLRVMIGMVTGLSAIFPSTFPRHMMASDDLLESRIVDQVSGAFFLIRRTIFDLCGGFDEKFFMYFEEVDLSARAKHLGYFSYYISTVSAFHKGGGCSENVKAARLLYSLRSRIIYAKKHYSTPDFLWLILLTAIEFPIRIIKAAFDGSWQDAINTSSAYVRLVVTSIRRY